PRTSFWGDVLYYGREIGRQFGGRSSAPDGEQLPDAGHALQLVFASVLELQSRASDKVNDCARNEDDTRTRGCHHTRRDVDSDARDVVAAEPDLSSVQTQTDLQAELAYRITERAGAPDRASGTVEGGEGAVAGEFHVSPPKPLELSDHGGVVLVENGP